MKKRDLDVFCGNGRGKTALAIGEAVKASAKGESVIIIQFLKGSESNEVGFLEGLDSLDIKVFRFEKLGSSYNDLTEEEKAEERVNILNGMNFARKVIATRECDFLVLDEVLGLIELQIVSREMIEELLGLKDETMRIVLTGREFPQWLAQCVDSVTVLDTKKRA